MTVSYRQPARPQGAPATPGARRRGWSDQRAERVLGALAVTVLVFIVGMVIFVFANAWPSFRENGLAWFADPPGDLTVDQQIFDIFNSPAREEFWEYGLNTWPLLWGTFLSTAGAVVFGVVFAVLAAVFIVEFAPPAVNKVLEPVVRLLAAVPSVIYGLIGILVLVPLVDRVLVTDAIKDSVAGVLTIDGSSLLVAVVILTVMISPIMIAIIVDALRGIPRAWTEGAAALGANRWRVMWTVSLRASRPAIIAAVVLASARAIGEAIMLSMVAGSSGFAPNPLDGFLFFLEPIRPYAATIVDNREGLTVAPFGDTIYAFAAVLLVSALFLSLAGWAAKQPLKRYGVQV